MNLWRGFHFHAATVAFLLKGRDHAYCINMPAHKMPSQRFPDTQSRFQVDVVPDFQIAQRGALKRRVAQVRIETLCFGHTGSQTDPVDGNAAASPHLLQAALSWMLYAHAATGIRGLCSHDLAPRFDNSRKHQRFRW